MLYKFSKIILGLLILLAALTKIDAQVIRALDFTIEVENFPYSMAELLDLDDNYSIVAHNLTTEDITCYLQPEIYKDNDRFAFLSPEYMGIVVNIPANQSVNLDKQTLGEMFQMDIFPDNIFPVERRELMVNSVLPEGVYQICLNAFNAAPGQENVRLSDGHPITCSDPLEITGTSQPLALFPSDCEAFADENEPINFDWLMPVGFDHAIINDDINYHVELQIIEIPSSEGEDEFGVTDFDLAYASDNNSLIRQEIPLSQVNNSFQFFPDGRLTFGNEYAWRLEIVRMPGLNADAELIRYYSDIISFTYSDNCFGDSDDEDQDENEDEDSQNGFSCENCKIEEAVADTPFSGSSIPNEFQAGHFVVRVKEDKQGTSTTQGSDKVFSGAEGIVSIALPGIDFEIPLLVSIENLILNADRQMKSGTIKTLPLDIDDSFFTDTEITDANGNSMSLEDLKELDPEQYDNYISSLEVGVGLLSQVNSLLADDGLAMPIGLDHHIDGKDYRMTIDEIGFNPDGAALRATVNFPLPVGVFSDENTTRYISFGLNDVCVAPDGTFGPSNFFIQKSLPILRNINGYSLFLDGCEDCDNETAESNGSYISVACDGLTGGQIDLRLDFPNQEDAGIDGFYLKPYVSSGNNEESGMDQNNTSSRVSASFELKLDSDSESIDWVSEVNIEPFELSVFPDWGFTVQEASIDFSDTSNPTPFGQMASIFPEGHNTLDESIIENWMGIYIRRLALNLPTSLDSEGSTSIEINNGIFDFNNGQNFSIDIAVNNIGLELDAEGWGIGLHKIDVSILNKSFDEGSLEGDLEAPFLADGDGFKYHASILLSEDLEHLNYAFRINPASESDDGQVNIPLMLASANLSPSSHIALNYEASSEENPFKFVANLIGDLGIAPETIDWIGEASQAFDDLPLELGGIPFLLKYENEKGFAGSYLGLNTELESIINSELNAITEDFESITQSFSFTRPEEREKKLLGINLDFKKAEIGGTLENPSLLLEPRLMVMDDGSTSSTQSGFGIDARVRINAKLEEGKYRYNSHQFECLGLDYQSAAVSVRGSVCYEKNLEEKTKVLSGEIMVDVAGLGGGIAAAASYGSKYHDENFTNKDFSFWYAKLALKIDAGIPMGQSGFSIYGLGGGIFYNYRLAEGGGFMSQFGRAAFAPASERDDLYGSSGLTPEEGFYGLGVWSLFGPSGEPRGFNFDVGLVAQFSSNSFLMEIEGNAYTMLESMWGEEQILRENSPIYGQIRGTFSVDDFSTGESEILIAADIGVAIPPRSYPGDPIIYTASHDGSAGLGMGEAVISSERIHAYMGVPRDYIHDRFDNATMGPINVKASLGNALEFDSEFYLMFGEGVPSSISLPQEIIDLQNNIGNDTEGGSASYTEFHGASNDRPPLPSGSGFAVGGKLEAGIEMTVGASNNLTTGVIGKAIVGFDLNLTRSEARKCDGLTPGIDGWYALGQMYAGLDFRAYILGQEFIKLQGVAAIEGGMPNPVWFTLDAKLSYDMPVYGLQSVTTYAVLESADLLLDGFENSSSWDLFGLRHKGSFEIKYDYNEPCLPYIDYTNTDETPFPLIRSITPGHESSGHDVLNTEIVLTLHNPHREPVDVEIMENGSLQTVRFTTQLDYLRVKKGSESIASYTRDHLPVNDYRLVLDDLLFEANQQYLVEVKMDLLRNGSVYDSETRVQSFETGNLPTELSDDYIVSSFPERWHNYFRVDDYELGFIEFKPNLYNTLFNNNPLDISELIPSATLNNFSSGQYSINQNTSVNNGSLSNGGSPLQNLVIIDPQAEEESEETSYRILIVNRLNHTDRLIKPVSFDHNRKRLNFSLDGLNPESKYDLFLQMKQGEEFADLYSIRFNTSKYRSMLAKLNAITTRDKMGKTVYLDEAFDTYDQKYLSVIYHVVSPTFKDLSAQVEIVLNQESTFNLESSSKTKKGQTTQLGGQFVVGKRRSVNIMASSEEPNIFIANALINLKRNYLARMSDEFQSRSLNERFNALNLKFVQNSAFGFEHSDSQAFTQFQEPDLLKADMNQIFTDGLNSIQTFATLNFIDTKHNKWLSHEHIPSLGAYVTIPNQWTNFFNSIPDGPKLMNEMTSLLSESAFGINSIVNQHFQMGIKYEDPNAKIIQSSILINQK